MGQTDQGRSFHCLLADTVLFFSSLPQCTLLVQRLMDEWQGHESKLELEVERLAVATQQQAEDASSTKRSLAAARERENFLTQQQETIRQKQVLAWVTHMNECTCAHIALVRENC